jgi:hypothetical protein
MAITPKVPMITWAMYVPLNEMFDGSELRGLLGEIQEGGFQRGRLRGQLVHGHAESQRQIADLGARQPDHVKGVHPGGVDGATRIPQRGGQQLGPRCADPDRTVPAVGHQAGHTGVGE